jgi:hypothetical protein
MGLGPCREKKRYAVMLLVCQVDAQIGAGVEDCASLGEAADFGDQRQILNELASAAQIACDRNLPDLGTRPFQGPRSVFQEQRCPVQVELFRAFLRNSDPLKNLVLQGGAKPLRRFDTILAGSFFERCQ